MHLTNPSPGQGPGLDELIDGPDGVIHDLDATFRLPLVRAQRVIGLGSNRQTAVMTEKRGEDASSP